MSSDKVVPPPVFWAQRSGLIYLNIALEDSKNPTINIETDKLYFSGVGGTDQKQHEVTLNFYGKVNPDESKYVVRDRTIEFVIAKEEDKWWPRLVKETTKFHWLRVDFNKWKDEDDSEDELRGFGGGGGPGGDFEEMMRSMGGMGGAGAPNFDGLNDDDVEEGSDEENLPELEEAN